MRKFKMTLKDMNKVGITLANLIRLDNLGYVGFNNEIVDAMIKYDIFPDLVEYRGDVYVQKDHIFGVVQKLLKSAMKLYEAVETVDNHVEKMAKEISESVPLTAEDLALVENGSMTMSELITKKQSEVTVTVEDDATVE